MRRRTYEAFRSLDHFRRPRDEALLEPTFSSQTLTLVALVLCSTLLAVQLHAFVFSQATTRLQIDSDETAVLRINFDVTMFDLACDHATIGVFDAYGGSRTNITRNVQKQVIGHDGEDKGHPFTEEELTDLEFADRPQLSDEERAELDSDWIAVAGDFEHADFRSALEAHDFVFVFYCIADFGPCRVLLKAWTRFATKVNEGEREFKDADGNVANVRAIQVNCARGAFEELCKEQAVRKFPDMRLYPRTISEKPKHVEVNIVLPLPMMMLSMGGVQILLKDSVVDELVKALTSVAARTVEQRHLHTHASHHAVFQEGCRLRGHLDVPRVPGTLHFEAANAADHALNYAFTNVSHRINHLSFGDSHDASSLAIPSGYERQSRSIDSMTFASEKFHQGPHHYVKVVHTRVESDHERALYVMTHQWHIRTYPRHEVPKAKLSYDLAPVEVVISEERHWYDFATSTFAIVGGAFSSLTMVHWTLTTSADVRASFVRPKTAAVL